MPTTNKAKRQLFFVDDEARIRKIVRRTLKRLDVECTCFASAHDCLEQLRCQRCDLLITDVRMPDMDGLALAEEARRIAPWMDVLVVSGYGDIPMAVRALKVGAVDFLEKPLSMEDLRSAVVSSLARTDSVDPLVGLKLTKAERRVLYHILGGHSNKQTARILRRSEKTIEVHRSHIMRKLAVDNTVALVKRAVELGLIPVLRDE